ncbi:hypothetical protein MMC06_001233 [Schaereria dolodes]|nr:hypothetical protein [Schaereria dolodes]
MAIVARFDASNRRVKDLEADSAVLELLRNHFGKMVKEDSFDVYASQKAKGFKGVRGLTGRVSKEALLLAVYGLSKLSAKVFEHVPSGLYDDRERKDVISANGIKMLSIFGSER